MSSAARADYHARRVQVRNVSFCGLGLGLLFRSHDTWCGNTQLLRAAQTFSAGQAASAGAQLFEKASVKNARALSRARGWFSCHAGVNSEAEQRGRERGFITSSSPVLCSSSPSSKHWVDLVQKARSLIAVIRNRWGFAHRVACPFESLIL